MPTKRLLPHHSISQWAHTAYPAAGWAVWTWELSVEEFITAPSSLLSHQRNIVDNWCHFTVYAGPGYWSIPEGQIDTYLQVQNTSVDCYSGILFGCSLYTPGNFQYSILQTDVCPWKRFRVTWWNSYNLLNEAKLAIKKEYWDTDHWVDLGVTYGDRWVAGKWVCGFLHGANVGHIMRDFWDETFIYY